MAYMVDVSGGIVKKGHIEPLRQVLAAFEVRGFFVDIFEDRDGALLDWTVEHDEDSDPAEEDKESWSIKPQAFLRDQEEDEMSKLASSDGTFGLLLMMRRIAPHLTTPIMVAFLMRTPDDPHNWSVEIYLVAPDLGYLPVCTFIVLSSEDLA